MNPVPRRPLLLLGLGALGVIVGAPLIGWPAVVRLSVVLIPLIVVAAALIRPWRATKADWDALASWAPSRRLVGIGAIAAGAILFWIVLTRFYSGEINAVDFTVYYDRPCYQTVHARPLFIETTDFDRFSFQSALGHHAYWAMLPLCTVYAIHPTPLWLLGLSVLAVVMGAVHLSRIVRRAGVPGIVAVAGALAFLLNDNTARTLQYGFHPEVLFAWFIPWLIDAGLARNRPSFMAAAVATILVKESAVMSLFAASVALALNGRAAGRSDRMWLVVPPALGLVNLIAYYVLVVPALAPAGDPAYAYFWASYGPTPLRALAGMAGDPLRVMRDVVSSAFFTKALPPHAALLPLIGWRWTIGLLPMVVIFSTSDDAQLREFGIYYSIPMVPFLAIGAASGALLVARRVADASHAPALAAAVVLGAAVIVGSGDRGYTLRPWRAEIAAVDDVVAALGNVPLVLVQSGLYPHAGYDTHVQLLTPERLKASHSQDRVLLLAPDVGAYPFAGHELEALIGRPGAVRHPSGLVVIRAGGLQPSEIRPGRRHPHTDRARRYHKG